jgi:hypothetical protein
VVWLLGDELPCLHPGKVHAYFDFDENVTGASTGEHILNTGGASDTIWLKPGSYELKFEIEGTVYAKSIKVTNETYIGLDDNPPYIHGDD